MKSTSIIIALVVIFVAIGILVYFNNNFVQKTNTQNPDQKKVSAKSDSITKDSTIDTSSSRYFDFSKTTFDKVSDKKRIYFFHAKWCPTCKAANEEFMQNNDKIPTDVVLFKTDYDTEKELKAKYGITYQHTFVYVDSSGSEIKKWNGGGVAELISNTSQ